MKRIISLLVAVVLLFSVAMTVSAQNDATTFNDVSREHYAYDAVEYFYRQNVIKGVGENKYEPDAFITREQFAKMISIIYGKETYSPSEQTFSDVTPDMWSYTYIESVKEYLTGYYPEGGKAFFNPAARATREDIAYALVKIGGLEKYTDLSVLDKYEDNLQISVNLREYIAAAVNAGLMQGYENKLRPQDGCTRAEVAALLFRAIKKPVNPENEDVAVKDDDKESTGKDKIKIKTDDIIAISGYTQDDIEGTLKLEWIPGEKSAKFEAKLKCNNGGLGDYVNCTISLEEVIYSDKGTITGYFDFAMNDKLRHDNIKGEIVIDKDTLKLNTEEYDYALVAELDDQENEKVTDTSDKKNKEPEDDKDDDKKPSIAADNIIRADDILEFKIINTDEENIFVDDPERLDGNIQIIFGEDGIKDTKLIGHIIVDDKDEYIIESYYIDRYDITSSSVLLELNYTVHKNGKLIIDKGGYRLYVHDGDDEMTLNGRVHFVAMDITWASGKLPKEPLEQPWELWADSSSICYMVKENGIDTGYINYIYKTEKKISKFDSRFTMGEDTYSIELVKELSKSGDTLAGKFNVLCNGEVIHNNIDGKIVGYNGKPGESATLVIDEAFETLELIIVEKTL